MKRIFLGIWISMVFAAANGVGADENLPRIPIDAGRQEFDIEMSFSFIDENSGWAVWKSYLLGKEKVLARRLTILQPPLDASSVSTWTSGPVIELTEKPGTIGEISTALIDEGTFRVTWAELGDEGWRLVECDLGDTHRYHRRGGVSPTGESRHELTVDRIGYSRASHRLVGKGSAVFFNVSDGLQHAGDRRLSEEGTAAFRPRTVSRGGKDGGEQWVFWDAYAEGSRWISAASANSPGGKTERVSPPEPGVRCLDPVPLDSSSEGLCVAWIKLTDVIGGDGVVDMVHTAHVARRTGEGKWEPVTDEAGSDEGAVMLSGLLPDLRKGKGYPSGYSGRRRHPMLLDAGDEGAWLIWERKSKHAGSGTRTAGQLLGRRFKDGKWVTGPLLLHEGLIDYRLAKPERVRGVLDHRFFYVVGSDIPKHWARPSYLAAVNLKNAKPIELDDWRDQFEPVDLPFDDEPKERHTAEVEGKKYRLYWGDLHCHSGLTGDAEGEPDEIVLYARDRAKLDVMVLQDNDEVHGRPLTEGEYRLGMTHSQWITEAGKFVALPGYEWTQRTSKKGVPDPFGSAFEQVIPNGYPNHRTVIYPMKGGPIVRYFEVGHDFDLMARTVHGHGGILHSQHPAFEISDHPAETNLEVTACWGVYIRSVPERFHGELNKGRRMGFIGTSDSHRRNPGLCGGLTGIYAEELTPEAIHAALRDHRVFATNGSKIVVDSRADGQLSDVVVKSEDGSVTLSLFLRGTRPITQVKLMADGKTVARFQGDGSPEFRTEKRIEGLAEGDHWFYWAIEQEGNSTQYAGNISVARGNLAWSSPHFVEVGERTAVSAADKENREEDNRQGDSNGEGAIGADASDEADTAVRPPCCASNEAGANGADAPDEADTAVRPPTSAKPDVLMIAVDDLRPALGCYGDPVAKTPNIDRLAKRGLVFERAYCQFAKCGPSRLSLLTGLRPDAVGVFSHRDDEVVDFRKRRPDAVSLVRWFRDHGWDTRGFGKIYHDGWDNPEDWSAPAFPGRPGEMLETVDEAALVGVPFAKRSGVATIISPRQACPVMQSPEVPDDALFAGRMTGRALDVLADLEKKDAPWFVAVGFRRPHLPFVAPKKYFDRYRPEPSWLPENREPPKGAPVMAWFNSDGYTGFQKRVDLGGTFPNPPKTRQAGIAWNGFEMRSYLGVPYHGPISDALQLRLRQAYFACVSYVDAQVGRLLDAIDDDVIVVLWSDHGWHLGEQSAWGKMTNYELATRVPLILAVPGGEFPAGRTRALAELVDLYPTFCELAGIEKPSHLEGESLVPILKNPSEAGTGAAFSQYSRYREKFLGRAIRTGRWRYVSWRERKTGETAERELYDHDNDPGETTNLAARPEHAAIVGRLEKRLGEENR